MEIPLAELQRNLKTVRLHGMSATLETRLVQANQGASFVEVFACLVQDEMDWRNSRLTETRFKASGLPERPTLTEFDWGFNPKLPKKEIYELVSGKFIRDGADALLIGSPGTGKSHIAKTVAHLPFKAATRSSIERPMLSSKTSLKPINSSGGRK